MTQRVYLVDDDTLVTDSLGTALRLETPFDVLTFNDAAAALEAMPGAPPDVVLSDLKMPRLGGLPFLKQVRSRHPDAVLMLLTGYADKESAIAAINEVGIWQYVEKPWSFRELLLKIRQGLERRELQASLERSNRELEARVRELEAAREQLVQAERLVAVGRVMAGLAHEIGNQLGFMGYAQLILDRVGEGGDAEVAEYARAILATQQRLASMIGEIKDFTRGEGGYRREPGDVAEVVREAINLLQFDRDVKSRVIKMQLLARPLGLLHRGKLLQAVLNLLRNAAQASPPGGEVRVVVDSDAGEGGGAVVRVIDRGAGMSASVLARLGEPFFTTREGGTGLGLGITRRIVEEHGGTLRFRSEPGAGTEVELRLPPLGAQAAPLSA